MVEKGYDIQKQKQKNLITTMKKSLKKSGDYREIKIHVKGKRQI